MGLALVSLTAVSAWSLFIGVSDIGIADLLRAESSRMLLFVESRVPRLAAILLSGSAMGVVGLIMQSLVRNRFVAPTTAGTVDAASLGLVIATVWFASASVFLKMTIAVIFALAGTALFMALVQRLRYAADIIVVPLIGIMLGGVIQAAATFIALRYDLLQSLSAWTNGDFSGILRGRYELLYLVGAMTVMAYLFANRFTLAGMGRDVAVNLGVNYHRVLYGGMALAASVSAVAVVVVGGIPFLGLVVPNLVTMTMGDNLRRVLPLTAVSGAFFVLVCDIVSRTIRFPYEIPVGTVVGVVGGAIFLALVLRSRFNAG
ncbi:MAG: iron chelate uptake ABC transporter family permease subunit [Deltaproteobacteria bacterium]|nr:iron chelate uptake ABC transporter family permease subunit [Deltaproteobacteria bacterium]